MVRLNILLLYVIFASLVVIVASQGTSLEEASNMLEKRHACSHDSQCGENHYCSRKTHHCHRKLGLKHHCSRDVSSVVSLLSVTSSLIRSKPFLVC
jgi:hypothetical protein